MDLKIYNLQNLFTNFYEEFSRRARLMNLFREEKERELGRWKLYSDSNKYTLTALSVTNNLYVICGFSIKSEFLE